MAILALAALHPMSAGATDAAYGAALQGFAYPWPVAHFRFTSQGDDLDMAYMDVKLAHPNGRVAAIGKALAPKAVQATLGNYPVLGKDAAARIPHATLVEFPDLGPAMTRDKRPLPRLK